MQIAFQLIELFQIEIDAVIYTDQFTCYIGTWTGRLISVLRVASGPRLKLASCKSALNPPVVYSTDRSKAVVPVLVLLFVALWFILRGDLLYVFPCVILFLCFSVLLILRLPRLGKRANLSAFHTFVRFVLVWICRFPLPLGVWEGLRVVIVAFVCVEVLRPSQPNGVMSSAVSLPNHTFTGQA